MPIETALAGLAAGAEMAWNAASADKSYERQRKLTHLENELNQQAQVNAASNVVKGYKKAGISPALAANGNFSPVGVSVSGTNKADSVHIDPMAAQAIRTSRAEEELLNAEKRNVDSQTRGNDIDNDRKSDEDAATDENLRNLWQILADDAVRRGNTALADQYRGYATDSNVTYTKGSANAMEQYNNIVRSLSESQRKLSADKVEISVNRLIDSNPAIKNAMASLPVTQQKELKARISREYADAYAAYASGDLSQAQADEIPSRIEKNIQEAWLAQTQGDKTHNSDARTLINNGEFGKLAVSMSADVASTGLRMVENLPAAAIGGKLIGKGLSKAGSEVSSASKASGRLPLTNRFFDAYKELKGKIHQRGMTAEKFDKVYNEVLRKNHISPEQYNKLLKHYGVSGAIPRRK